MVKKNSSSNLARLELAYQQTLSRQAQEHLKMKKHLEKILSTRPSQSKKVQELLDRIVTHINYLHSEIDGRFPSLEKSVTKMRLSIVKN